MDEPKVALPKACWGCERVLDPQDAYCRYCGRGQDANVPWYYKHWGIALATVLGLGPFGVVLVWRAPRLSTAARLAWTAAILGLTVWTGIRLYQAFKMAQALSLQYIQGMGL